MNARRTRVKNLRRLRASVEVTDPQRQAGNGSHWRGCIASTEFHRPVYVRAGESIVEVIRSHPLGQVDVARAGVLR